MGLFLPHEYSMIDFVGNFHSLLTFRNEKELNIVRELVHRMVERAIRLDGTCMCFLRQLHSFPLELIAPSLFRYGRAWSRHRKERILDRGAWRGHCRSHEDHQTSCGPALVIQPRKGKCFSPSGDFCAMLMDTLLA
jgi:hypothetical protein